jgi:hypothetical protein
MTFIECLTPSRRATASQRKIVLSEAVIVIVIELFKEYLSQRSQRTQSLLIQSLRGFNTAGAIMIDSSHKGAEPQRKKPDSKPTVIPACNSHL